MHHTYPVNPMQYCTIHIYLPCHTLHRATPKILMVIESCIFPLQVIDKIKEDIMKDLVQSIQNSCPEYLCQDLVLREVRFTCSTTDNAAVEFSALASGVGAQDSVRAFLQNLEEEPVNLSINGTSVQVTSTAPPTTSTPKTDVGLIVTCTGGVFVLLLLLVVLASSCALWHW